MSDNKEGPAVHKPSSALGLPAYNPPAEPVYIPIDMATLQNSRISGNLMDLIGHGDLVVDAPSNKALDMSIPIKELNVLEAAQRLAITRLGDQKVVETTTKETIVAQGEFADNFAVALSNMEMDKTEEVFGKKQ